MDKPKKKPIKQNDDDFDNGYDTGYNVAPTEWEKYHHMVLHESNCEWYNKGLEAQKNIDERNELTEDEIEKIIGSVEGCNTDYTIYIKNIARAISTRLKGKE